MKFLIFGGPGIGDTIIEMTLAKGLKSNYPKAEVYLILSDSLGTFGVVQSLLKCQDYIDDCYFYSRRHILSTFFTLQKLRQKRIDYAFACSSSFKANSIPSKICSIIKCACVMKKVKTVTNKSSFVVDIPENINIVKQYEMLLNFLVPEGKLDIEVINADYIKDCVDIAVGKRGLITICLGTNITIYKRNNKRIKKNIKEWDVFNWCELANMLAQNGYNVVFIGGEKEKNCLNKLELSLHPLVNSKLIGNTSIKESLSIIEKSILVIGADTGMMHCAAALGRKTISLFGGTPAEVWHPYSSRNYVIKGNVDCAPCYGKDYAIDCSKRICMSSITVITVFDYAIRIAENK